MLRTIKDDKCSIFHYLFAAIGGGGLISEGISTYFKTYSPTTKIIGVEPSGASK